jgi:hypothetical protein
MYTLTFALAAATTCPRAAPAPKATNVARSIAAGDLYSLRARKRMQTYLKLRLMELREAELDRVADVLRRRLPVEALLETPRPTTPPERSACATAR